MLLSVTRKTLGTELEVRSGSEEMIVQLHHTLQMERASSPLLWSEFRRNAGRPTHLGVPGRFFSQHLHVKHILCSTLTYIYCVQKNVQDVWTMYFLQIMCF